MNKIIATNTIASPTVQYGPIFNPGESDSE